MLYVFIEIQQNKNKDLPHPSDARTAFSSKVNRMKGRGGRRETKRSDKALEDAAVLLCFMQIIFMAPPQLHE